MEFVTHTELYFIFVGLIVGSCIMGYLQDKDLQKLEEKIDQLSNKQN